MLKITKKQFEQLKGKKSNEFSQEVLMHLSEYYPERMSFLGEMEEQLEWTQGVVDDAHDYGFDRKSDVYRYVRAAITFDEDFHKLPWAKEIFKLGVTPTTKSLLLEDAVTKRLEMESEKLERESKRLHKEKINAYAEEKGPYVYSFNVFYGLKLNGEVEAVEWTKSVCEKANEFGIIETVYLDSYLEVAMYYGPDFHDMPWAEEILTSDSSLNDKIKRLLTYLSEHYGEHTDG